MAKQHPQGLNYFESLSKNVAPEISLRTIVVSASSWMQLTTSFQFATRLITNLLSGKEF